LRVVEGYVFYPSTPIRPPVGPKIPRARCRPFPPGYAAVLRRRGSTGRSQDGTTRSAQRRKMAAPRLLRKQSGAAFPGLCVGVRTTWDARTIVPAQNTDPRCEGRLPETPAAALGATWSADAPGISTARSWPRRAGVRPAWKHANIHERKKNTARRPDLQNTRLGASPPRGTAARRGVSLGSANRGAARCQHRERPTSRLGVATERGLHKTARRNVETSHVPRTATAALKSTSGSGAPSVAVRQFCGSKASIQASFNGRRFSTSQIHRRKETKGEKRIEWPGGAHSGAVV
jgi:hypothetical protein